MTLRKLLWMARGRQKENWNHTSNLIASLGNIHAGTKQNPAPYDARKINPFETDTPKTDNKQLAPVSILKSAWVKKQ